MTSKRYVVMGAGAVGLHLARTLSAAGHSVIVIEQDEARCRALEEQLDVAWAIGNGARMSVLEAARVGSCDLFMAVSSSDEANLTASILAKRLGAPRTVVRVGTFEDVTTYRRAYEKVFRADLLLSTQLLATTRILNHLLGYNTLEVEYLAHGQVQLRRTHLDPGSILTQRRLRDIELPEGSLVVAYLSRRGLIVPGGADQAKPGDHALIIAKTAVIDEVEKMVSSRSHSLGLAVIAGGGETAFTVAKVLGSQVKRLKIIELDRGRAETLAEQFPQFEIVHGDARELPTLAAEGVANADGFVALMGDDESNLMACLLAQDLGARQITALVDKSETSSLWRKVGLLDIISPRVVAAERIGDYIESGYQGNVISFENGAAQFMQRRLEPASPAAGVKLADLSRPSGLIVAVVMRDGDVFVPRGRDRLEVGDEVILFVDSAEVATVQLFFPGPESE